MNAFGLKFINFGPFLCTCVEILYGFHVIVFMFDFNATKITLRYGYQSLLRPLLIPVNTCAIN
jgi:hypothetical protein